MAITHKQHGGLIKVDGNVKIGLGVLCASMLALALLVAAPSPMTTVKLVMSAPVFDAYTDIAQIWLDNSDNLTIVDFTNDGASQDLDVGLHVTRFQVYVKISTDYATSEAAAHANTRIYLTLTNPSATVVWENYLDNTTIETEYGDYWYVLLRGWPVAPIELTAGTWTLTTEYQAYA